LLSYIEHCSTQELDLIRQNTAILLDTIDLGINQRQPETRQRAMVAIGRLQISSHYHHLVNALCNSRDPQQMVAMELVGSLTRRYGAEVRSGNRASEAQRQALLTELFRAIESLSSHHVSQVVGMWLSGIHWDDPFLSKVFPDDQLPSTAQNILLHWTRSHSKEMSELSAGLFWSRVPSKSLLLAQSERTDIPFIQAIATQHSRLGVTSSLKKNLGLVKKVEFLRPSVLVDEKHSPRTRCALVSIHALQLPPTEELLWEVAQLMACVDGDASPLLAAILDGLKCINSDIVVMALSDCLDAPDTESSEPPPWKESMRASLELILEHYPKQTAQVKASLANYFGEFKCDEFMAKLDVWPRGHLVAYSRMLRVANPKYADYLAAELLSKGAHRKIKGIRAIRIFGLEGTVWEPLVELLQDDNYEVRICAIQAIADDYNRSNAIDVLMPLLKDLNQSVTSAATAALQSLGAPT
jgi:hypothetical protein